MKKFLYLVLILIITIVTIFIAPLIYKNNKNNNEKEILGVWWWDNRIDNSYLDFAQENGVTEIYYYVSDFNEKIANFIKEANLKNIKVYWLTGKYQWIENYGSLKEEIAKYLDFQKNNNNLFAGIHFDIEPHQHPEFNTRKEEIIFNFIDLTFKIKNDYKDVFVEYDLPCWLDDVIEYNGESKPAFEYVFDNANRITLMSYRDSAEKICNFAKDEIDYATKNNKKLILGVETQDVNDSIVSFFEEGKEFMNQELKLLRKLIPKNFGIAIHHIVSWFDLK